MTVPPKARPSSSSGTFPPRDSSTWYSVKVGPVKAHSRKFLPSTRQPASSACTCSPARMRRISSRYFPSSHRARRLTCLTTVLRPQRHRLVMIDLPRQRPQRRPVTGFAAGLLATATARQVGLHERRQLAPVASPAARPPPPPAS